MSTPEAAPEAAKDRQVPVRTAAAKPAPPSVARTALKPRLARPAVNGEDRYRMIAEAAYFRAEQRGFAPGHDLADWLAAEMEIDVLLGDEDRGRGTA